MCFKLELPRVLKLTLLLLTLLGFGSIALADESPAPLKLEGKMVCIGASITAGADVQPQECYVQLLRARVQAAHLNLEVIQQGRSGWSTGAYVANGTKMQAAIPPDTTIISILLGTNDSRDKGTPEQVGHRAGVNLEKLIDLYQQRVPKVQFVIALPTAQYPQKLIKRLRDANYGDASAANIKQIQAAFRAVAVKRHLLIVDLSGLPSTPEKSLEGIHPTPEGHVEICDAFWKAMNPLPATTQPSPAN